MQNEKCDILLDSADLEAKKAKYQAQVDCKEMQSEERVTQAILHYMKTLSQVKTLQFQNLLKIGRIQRWTRHQAFDPLGCGKECFQRLV